MEEIDRRFSPHFDVVRQMTLILPQNAVTSCFRDIEPLHDKFSTILGVTKEEFKVSYFIL